MPIVFQRDDIPIRGLASGAQLTIPVFTITGDRPGRKVYIQANIHGPEIAGIGAIHVLLGILRQQAHISGSLVVVPSVNPVGLDTKVNGLQTGYADPNETIVGNFNRIYSLPVTDSAPATPDPTVAQKVALDAFVAEHLGSDLPTIKRAFRAAIRRTLDDIDEKRKPYGATHGGKLASIIQHLSYDADDLLDLHTAGDAVYHLFTFPECFHGVRYLDLPRVIALEDSFSGVLDEAFLLPWLRLTKAFAKAGRQIDFRDFELDAYTPELGSADTLSASAMQADAARIVNYLRYKGVLEGEAVRADGDHFVFCPHPHYRVYRAPTGGLLVWDKAPGDAIRQGERLARVICTYRHAADNAPSDQPTEIPIIAATDGIIINRSESHVVQEGFGLCSVFTQVHPLVS